MGLEIPLEVLKHLGEGTSEAKSAPQPHLHPPVVSYVGDEYRFRSVDGSGNNIHNPQLGQAGCPFARTIRTSAKAHGAKPDAGLLFDSLMSRGGEPDEPNPAGVSKLLFFYTSLVAYDIFYQQTQDIHINATSSYLDLSPLYGKDKKEQDYVRTFTNGLLKKDVYAETRPSIPPGVMVLLVMFNRFHNFAATTVLGINERGRFTPPKDKSKEYQAKWVDQQVFQTARAITVGLYVVIILHDYMRAITNSAPNVADGSQSHVSLHDYFQKQGLPEGAGNQMSIEYSILYRLNAFAPLKDMKPYEDTYRKLFDKDPSHVSPQEILKALDEHAKANPGQQQEAKLGNIKRGDDGVLPDAQLVEILANSIEEVVPKFGTFYTSDMFRPIVMLSIEQARKWHVPSLNEFREFLCLPPFKTFEEINSNADAARTMKNLYGDVNHVEMYPGIFFEEQAKELPASTTMVKGLLASALSLIRGDRFLTHEYTPNNLTAWGITEIAPDYTILNGAKIFLLILNSFGSYFAFNSVYSMLPFFTPPRSKEIVDRLGIADQFTFNRPKGPTPPPVPVLTAAGLKQVLGDQQNFLVPWGPKLMSLSSFMLASDKPETAKQKVDVGKAVYGQTDAEKKFEEAAMGIARRLLRKKSRRIGRGAAAWNQVDIVRDVANLAATHFVAKLVYLPLGAPTGPSYTEDELTKLLGDAFLYIFADSDPTKSWAVRRDGDGPVAKLANIMEDRVQHLIDSGAVVSGASAGGCPVKTDLDANDDPLDNWGANLAKRLLATGRKKREVAEILTGLAVGLYANAGMLLTQTLDFYLNPATASSWADIKSLSANPTPENDKKITHYQMEGYRLANTLALLRFVKPGSTVEIETAPGTKTKVTGGQVIFLSFIAACHDPVAFPNPNAIDLTRPLESYIHYGWGPHQCLGRNLNMAYARGMLKVISQLPGLKRTPGDEGVLHYVPTPSGLKNYLDREWKTLGPLPSNMKVMWQGAPLREVVVGEEEGGK